MGTTGSISLKRLIRQVVHFFLYGNYWIALAALCMTWQTDWVLIGKLELGQLDLFIFSATLFLYASHRLVSLHRMKEGQWQERFFYISKSQGYIYIYATFALLATAWFYFHLTLQIQLAILLPGLISLAYVFPILKGKKRIRDLHFIKIFLIALVWAWITVYIPALETSMHRQMAVPMLFLERVLFIFAITLPFDIRDLLLDEKQAVKTLPSVLGIKATRKLAAYILIGMLVVVSISSYLNVYSIHQLLALMLSMLVAYALIFNAHPKRADYYFTAFLDGTMILQFGMLYLFSMLF